MYDSADQRFVSATSEKLEEMWAETTIQTAPPFQRLPSDEPLVVAVYLNKKRPLSEPKWCRTNSADEWLFEQFGAKRAGTEGGWKGKLEVVDPDPVRLRNTSTRFANPRRPPSKASSTPGRLPPPPARRPIADGSPKLSNRILTICWRFSSVSPEASAIQLPGRRVPDLSVHWPLLSAPTRLLPRTKHTCLWRF